MDALVKSEHMTDEIKTQLNDLCRFSRDLSTHSSKVSGLIKEYNRYTFILFIVNQSRACVCGRDLSFREPLIRILELETEVYNG